MTKNWIISSQLLHYVSRHEFAPYEDPNGPRLLQMKIELHEAYPEKSDRRTEVHDGVERNHQRNQPGVAPNRLR